MKVIVTLELTVDEDELYTEGISPREFADPQKGYLKLINSKEYDGCVLYATLGKIHLKNVVNSGRIVSAIGTRYKKRNR